MERMQNIFDRMAGDVDLTVAEREQGASMKMKMLLAVLFDRRIEESGSWMVHEMPRRGFCK